MVKVALDETNVDGSSKVVPGKYHWLVDDVTVHENGSEFIGEPHVEVKLSVLAGSNPDQVNKHHREILPLLGKAASRSTTFAVAVGLYPAGQAKIDKEAGFSPDIDFKAAEGRQLCGEITWKKYGGKNPKYEGQEFPGLNWSMWPVFASESNGIPLDADYAKLLDPNYRPGGAMTSPPAPQGQQPAGQQQGGQQQPNNPAAGNNPPPTTPGAPVDPPNQQASGQTDWSSLT